MLGNIIVVVLMLHMHVVCGFTDDEFQQMVSKMVAMETRVATLSERDAEQQKVIDKQTEVQKQQRAKINELESMVSMLEEALNKQTATASTAEPLPMVDTPVDDADKKPQQLKGGSLSKTVHEIVHKISNKASQPRRRFVADETVAFMTQKTTTRSNIGIGQNIHFDVVMLNEGGGFHVQHGIFIAPQSGIYLFSTTLLTSNTNAGIELHAELVQNGHVLARIYGHGDNGRHDQGGSTVITQVQSGDEIWVRNIDAVDAVFGSYYSTFCGYLLLPM